MNTRKRTAIINALTKAGWGDVVMTDWEYTGDLKLNCEEWVDAKGMSAGDYYCESASSLYDDQGTSQEIAKILKKYKAYPEWYDASVIAVVA